MTEITFESADVMAASDISTEDRTLAAGRVSFAPGPDDAAPPTAQIAAIIAALREVHDPEIPVNIYDLGLIYRIDCAPGGGVEIAMTLTAPGCPVAGEMLKMVENAVAPVAGVSTVDVRLVFDPPWDNDRMTDAVKLELGLL